MPAGWREAARPGAEPHPPQRSAPIGRACPPGPSRSPSRNRRMRPAQRWRPTSCRSGSGRCAREGEEGTSGGARRVLAAEYTRPALPPRCFFAPALGIWFNGANAFEILSCIFKRRAKCSPYTYGSPTAGFKSILCRTYDKHYKSRHSLDSSRLSRVNISTTLGTLKWTQRPAAILCARALGLFLSVI